MADKERGRRRFSKDLDASSSSEQQPPLKVYRDENQNKPDSSEASSSGQASTSRVITSTSIVSSARVTADVPRSECAGADGYGIDQSRLEGDNQHYPDRPSYKTSKSHGSLISGIPGSLTSRGLFARRGGDAARVDSFGFVKSEPFYGKKHYQERSEDSPSHQVSSSRGCFTSAVSGPSTSCASLVRTGGDAARAERTTVERYGVVTSGQIDGGKYCRDKPEASTSRGSSNMAERPKSPHASTKNTSLAPANSVGTESARILERNAFDRFDIVNTRPAHILTKKGTNGTPIKLTSNFYRLKTKPEWRIFHYHVEFSPEIELVRVRCGVLSEHARTLGTGYLFDGSQLFTTKKFNQDVTVLKTTSKQGVNYTITIKNVGYISTVEPRYLQVLNLILRRSMKGLKLEQIRRNLFDPNAKISLREFSIELWPGYETSIRQHERDILVCVEITHKVLRTDTVYDLLRRTSANPDRHQDEFRSNALGLIVITDYNNMTYCINDVDFVQTPKATFSYKGKEISFVEYYLTKYNIRIRDQNQPLLVSNNRNKTKNAQGNDIVILIPELCRITGMTDSMRGNFQLMRVMSNHTRMNPVRRIERLQAFNRRLLNTADSIKVLTDWNMKLDDQLIEVQGHVIKPQYIRFNNNRIPVGEIADWTKHFRYQKMLTTPINGLDRWAVISPERNIGDLKNLLSNLRHTAKALGFPISDPRQVLIFDDRTSSYVQALDDCMRYDPKLILCLVPNNNTERYSAIKKRSCVHRPVPTQVVSTRANKNGLSVATKIAIQLNCKLGFAPWMIELPLSGLMTIGFDIAKCTQNRSKAYAALVASMDLQTNSTYYSTVSECSAYDVVANNLWPMVMKALKQYYLEHNMLPARIILYRDGVSSGSLQQLFEYEVRDIVEKLEIEYRRISSTGPKLAYIVVTKSSNTRFFHGNDRNPPAGTVVDDVVTLPERYDFYIVSQTVRQGTVSPTNYNVVYSNIGLSPDHLQIITYQMCHLYYNWSGTTRVPAVCQYAKKLATLVGTNLHAIPENALEKKLYYL